MNRRKVGYVLPGHVAAAVVSLYTNGLSGALGNAQGNNGAPVVPFRDPVLIGTASDILCSRKAWRRLMPAILRISHVRSDNSSAMSWTGSRPVRSSIAKWR